MKKNELLEKFTVEKVILKKLNFTPFFKHSSRKRLILLSLIFFVLSILSYISKIFLKEILPLYFWLISILISIGIFYVVLYLILSIKDIYDDSDEYIFTLLIAKLRPITKTFFSSIICVLCFAAVFLGVILLIILFCNKILNIYFYEKSSLIIGYIFTILVFLWTLRYFFSSILTILFEIEGFNSLKLSTIFLSKNRIFALIIPLIYWSLPFLKYYFSMNPGNSNLILLLSIFEFLISLLFIFIIPLSIFNSIKVKDIED